jgi:hypothetical protein
MFGAIVRTAANFLSGSWRRAFVEHPLAPGLFGPLLVDRGSGLIYDVERDITWLQDTNYAKTVGRSPDGQMSWTEAMAWVARLNYRGITGWRLPTALNPDGSGPCVGDHCPDGEFGHLVFTALDRKSAGLHLLNFESFSIYWTSTEASSTDAYAFKMVGLEQGTLPKHPWAPVSGLGGPIPLPEVVRVWPVHDGDVAGRLFWHLIDAIALPFRRR